ncbi:hypothetical protein MTBPR1_180012 [Candidatus Terasakiella magnetica]|uniref:Uncharacterized protein n=1 Tax=Candidatus Terasakiella magnetica TaxID=1867952 RepID=A0A1C3RFR1_9PROT|nr:hypothetical protein [Candidatus Terasakiella magnetica]SCA56099.1 hypothetical protein MTBPR1_180012 [Candidatus Terasakiella magnetica]
MLSATYAFWTFLGTAVLIQAVDEKQNIIVRRKKKKKKCKLLQQSQRAQQLAHQAQEKNYQYLTDEEQAMLKQVRQMENDMAAYRQKKTQELKEAVEQEKKKALADVFNWSAQEKQRLSERFNQEYEKAIEDIRGDVSAKVSEEFNAIVEHFENLEHEDKSMGDNEIREFLDKKKQKILSTLG